MIANILVEVSAKTINNMFSYLVPKELENDIKIGKRVLVPFGNRNVEGFVMELQDKVERENIKCIKDIIDDEVILNEELMNLGKYISKKTMCNLITAYQTMLPTALKAHHGTSVNKKEVAYVRVIDKEYIPRNDKQKSLLELIGDNKILKSDCKGYSSLTTLIKKGVIEESYEEEYRIKNTREISDSKRVLTDEQANALDKISSSLNTFKPFLLHGVTGSGKTEVYMQLIENVIENKQTAIVLVPEISLTPQLVNNFSNRFGSSIAILHSRLSAGEKYDEWRKISRGEVSIVIGARSAIFAPLENIGLIVIDEEHTNTYKQENNPKYHAIDIALNRAKYHKCPLVLGSATPSLESYTRAKLGVYELVTLKKRISKVMPSVELVDMVPNLKKGYNVFSKELLDALEECFNNNEQAIILLNRRGYSTVVTCHDCGYKVTCPNCDIPLTYHKKYNAMKCHYCNYTTSKPHICPNCQSKSIDEFGMGTEKLEEKFHEYFKDIKTLRMDVDTTSRKGAHDKIINAFASGEYKVLIGTQMIAKGLDFEDVTLVGVVSGDASLNIPDFRSAERTYSLLSQVAGRAGRSKKNGKVIIQGFNLNHYSIELASKHDYESFYEEEMKIRKMLHYPPYYNLGIIKIVGYDENKCIIESSKIRNYLDSKLSSNVEVLGPSASMNPKVNNKYYFQIMLKYKNTKEIIDVLSFISNQYKSKKDINIDIDLTV